MKKGLSYILFISIIIVPACFFSCEEVPPTIDFGKGAVSETTFVETTIPAAQQKAVLIEDLTGVKCINCPKADTLSEELMTAKSGRLIVMGIHSEDDIQFCVPYESDTTFDLRSREAADIESFIGGAKNGGKPSGPVDRYFFSGEATDTRALFTNKWESKVDERLNESTPVNIIIDPEWDASSLKLQAKIELHYTSSVTDTHYLSISLVENDVVAAQKTPDSGTFPPDGIDYNYIHDHVLRKMFTNSRGTLIQTTELGTCDNLDAGCVFVQTFEMTLKPHWKIDNCEVVAFVHYNSGSKLDIVHIVKAEAKD